jgi:hypothetical protein
VSLALTHAFGMRVRVFDQALKLLLIQRFLLKQSMR